MPDPFQPSPVRQGLDQLLAFYPHLDVLTVEWQIEWEEGLPGPHFGPWVLVKLGQASEGLTPAWAVWHFAIWRNTGAVHTMRDEKGEVSDDPIFQPRGARR
jgi:hypothetical protein